MQELQLKMQDLPNHNLRTAARGFSFSFQPSVSSLRLLASFLGMTSWDASPSCRRVASEVLRMACRYVVALPTATNGSRSVGRVDHWRT
jgi:hypothetical protein